MKLFLGFLSGVVSGIMLELGILASRDRTGPVGGEALILPLIFLLFAFGYSVGKEVKAYQASKKRR